MKGKVTVCDTPLVNSIFCIPSYLTSFSGSKCWRRTQLFFLILLIISCCAIIIDWLVIIISTTFFCFAQFCGFQSLAKISKLLKQKFSNSTSYFFFSNAFFFGCYNAKFSPQTFSLPLVTTDWVLYLVMFKLVPEVNVFANQFLMAFMVGTSVGWTLPSFWNLFEELSKP